MFTCKKCKKNFSLKGNLKCHIDNDSCNNKTTIKCKYCKRKFTTTTSMYRHIRNTCKVKKQDENEKKEIYERLLESIDLADGICLNRKDKK